MKQERFTAARIDAWACQPRRAIRHLLPLVATSLLTLHCALAGAGDIARDTPVASMALAEGLYAAPGPSAAVSVVATPTVTATALASEPPPKIVSAPAPAAIASPLPAKIPETPETTGWTNYVAMIAGIVGAITGIAGAIMGALALRRASKH